MSVVPQFRNRQFLITLTALTAAVVILLMTGLRANAVLMPDHITISPASATITAGGSQAFTAEGFNASNASLGDVTLTTTFTISPDGSCTGASCTATTAGDHTVTATNNGKTDTATLTVTAGPLDHLVLTPAAATIAAGTSQSFTAHGADIYGNSLDDVTSATAFGITPDGSCTGAGCTATTAGPHTVTGTDSTKTGTATLTVTAGSVTAAQSTVSASPASVKADGTTKSTVTVTLKDANGNPVSGKAASLSQGAGSSTISAASGSSDTNGQVTFTVSDATPELVTYTATDTTDGVTVTATASVTFSQTTWYVAATGGNDSGACTAASPCKTISGAIGKATDGGTINVAVGTYTESPNITKAVTLKTTAGAAIVGLVTVSSDSVTVSGFDLSNPSGTYAISIAGKSNVTVQNNTIHAVGTSGTVGNVHAVDFQMSSGAGASSLTVSHNTISNIGNAADTGSVSAISVLDSNGAFNLAGFTADDNTISGVTAAGAKGAYGILLNLGSKTKLVSDTAAVSGALITNNKISGLTGGWEHAIGLETNTPSAFVTGNTITAGSGVAAIHFEKNPSAASVTLTGTTFGGKNLLNSNTTVVVDPSAYVVSSSVELDTYLETCEAAACYYSGLNAFPTIQSGLAAVASGGTVNVTAGTYAESPNITRALTLQGSAGAAIVGLITVSSDTVTVDGFDLSNPTGPYAISISGKSDVTVQNNTIHKVGTDGTPKNVHAVDFQMSSGAGASHLTVSNNTISNIGGSDVTGSASAISVLDSTATQSLDVFAATGNTISGVTATGGAYGILVNLGSGGNSGKLLTDTASVTNASITNNNIAGLTGAWEHAIGLETNTPSANVSGNTIHDLPAAVFGATAIHFEKNPSAATVVLTSNKFGTKTLSNSNTTVMVDPSAVVVPSGTELNTYVETCEATACYYSGLNAFTTIQAAVNAAPPGGTVTVAAGTYNEQVVITRSLTLQGAGDATVIAPSSPSKLSVLYTYPSGVLPGWVGVKLAPVVFVENAASATVQNLKIDGSAVTALPVGTSRLSGILYAESGGLISHVTLNSIKTTGYADRTYVIDVSATGAARTVEVANNTITDFARTAIQVQGSGLTASVHDNDITGPGPIGGQVPNGIVFIQNAAGTASNNTIRALHFTGSDGSLSAGLMAYEATNASGVSFSNNEVSDTDDAVILGSSSTHITVGPKNNFHDNTVAGVQIEAGAAGNTITGNDIQTNGYGIRLDGSGESDWTSANDTAGDGNTAHNNTLIGNATDVMNWTAKAFDATNNWWGSAAGPGALTNVTTKPWCTNAACTIFSDNANLTGLSLSSGTLSPAFSAPTTSYSATVATNVNSVTVTATANPGAATPVVTGDGNMSIGSNTVTVAVTSADGSAHKTYTITITRDTPAPVDIGAGGGGGGGGGGAPKPPAPVGVVTLPTGPSVTAPIDTAAATVPVTNNTITTSSGETTATNFTSGTVSNVDLTKPQDVGGGATVTVGKTVTLDSGTAGTAITLTNTAAPDVSVKIPDTTTVLAPTGWDGKINPPTVTTAPPTDTAPSGFKVASTVVEVGSSTAVLLFDQPASVVLNGVTGPVGYRPAGSTTWVPISPCGAGGPSFPGACSVSDGTNTTILTYHFTAFAALIATTLPTQQTIATTSTGLYCFTYAGPATLAAALGTTFSTSVTSINRFNLPAGNYSSWFRSAPSLATLTSLANGDVICVNGTSGSNVFTAGTPAATTTPPAAPTTPTAVVTAATVTGVYCFAYAGPNTAVANFTSRFNSAITAVNRLGLPEGAFTSWFAAAPSLSTISTLNNGDLLCVTGAVGTSVFK